MGKHVNDIEKLRDIKLFLLDMDGTFYLGNTLLEGSSDFLSKLATDEDKHFKFITNNSSKSRDDYIKKLSSMGFDFPAEKVMTSGEATVIYLKNISDKRKVYLVGTKSLEDEFEKAGFILDEQSPDYVVLGFDTTLTYEKLWKMCDFVKSGVEYIATHPDFNCPIEGGEMPDIGAMIAFVKAATGKTPFVIGKPNKYIIDAAVDGLDIDFSQIAMVGDRLYTDIAIGKNAGINSILVLSGETKLEDLEGSDIVPDFIFSNLGEIAENL